MPISEDEDDMLRRRFEAKLNNQILCMHVITIVVNRLFVIIYLLL